MAHDILPASWDVPQVFRERLGEQVGRQRTMVAEGHLLAILHEPPEVGDRTRKGRIFWRKPDGTWSSDKLGEGSQSLRKHLTEYAGRLDEIESAVSHAGLAQEFFGVLRRLGPLRRAIDNLSATLQQAREAVPDDREIIVFRDQGLELKRTAELFYQDAKNGLDFSIASRAEQQARASHHAATSAHRLNLLAAFFFPIATLSAIFGMNLRHGVDEIVPSDPLPLPFLLVLGIGFLGGFLLTSFVGRAPQPSTEPNFSRKRLRNRRH